MRIAFYAPLKPPGHPVPSGDRRMARLLVAALERAGHQVRLASRLRAYDGSGDARTQARIRRLGEATAARLAARYLAAPPERRPQLWFTYHLYYKAPDWIGPAVSAALDIPYVVAEASHAGKRAEGPWAAGHAQTALAVMAAARVFCLNPIDVAGLLPLVPSPRRLVLLPPFLDADAYAAADRAAARAAAAARWALPPAVPWLIAVAMMRTGDKLSSYRLLGEALAGLLDRDWRLVVVGDGTARGEVAAALAPLGARVAWAGALDPEALPPLYAAADLCVWPAVNEAYGMAVLEAQAAGLPVVAGARLAHSADGAAGDEAPAGAGVAGIVADGETGLLVPVGEAAPFAAAVRRLLDDTALRRRLGAAARRRVAERHGIDAAAARIDAALAGLSPGRGESDRRAPRQ